MKAVAPFLFRLRMEGKFFLGGVAGKPVAVYALMEELNNLDDSTNG